MKKLSLLLIYPLLFCSCSDTDKTYQHVVIFGVDGAGGEFSNIDTPNFDRIFGSGSMNYHGLAQLPTMSAQNWGSMAYGVTPETHGKTNSDVADHQHTDENLPSFIKTHATKHEDATYYSAVNWKPINYGIFEDLPNLTKDNIAQTYPGLSSAEVDDKVAEHVIHRVQDHQDTIVFMQFDSVDHAGHAHGNQSNEYIQSIQHIDTLMGQIYDAYEEKNLLSSILFICVSDHGHTASGGHGGETDSEKAVTIAVNGGKGNIIQGSCESYTNTDLAPIVLHALNEEIPEHYQGKLPNNMFTE